MAATCDSCRWPSSRLTLPAEYDAAVVADLIAAANKQGDAGAAWQSFARPGSPASPATSRHARRPVGPALTDVGKRLKPEEIVEAILWPKRQVKPEFIAWRFRLTDGRTLQGYKRGETADAIELFDPAAQRIESLAKTDIEDQREAGTLMPDGLAPR